MAGAKAGKLTVVPTDERKRELLDKLGDISGVSLMHNNILIATYIRSSVKKLAGGFELHLADKTTDEDRYQGKVGLVVAKGPLAFVDDKDNAFHGQNVEIGDWVYYRSSDGWQMSVNGNHCRLLQDVMIRGKVANPDIVY